MKIKSEYLESDPFTALRRYPMVETSTVSLLAGGLSGRVGAAPQDVIPNV